MLSLLDRVLHNEGFKPKPYKDTAGVLTIGHGLTYLTRAESRAIVETRLRDLDIKLKKSKPWLLKYPSEVREIIVEMNFQLGVRGTNEFKKMFAALRKRDFKTAAAEMRDSKWYRQTPNRAERKAKRMEKVNG